MPAKSLAAKAGTAPADGATGGTNASPKELKPPQAPTTSSASRWETGLIGVRDTAKWVITTAGAAAAVIFGAGPLITKGELSGSWLWLRILLIGLSAAFGAAGLIYLIARTSAILMPRAVALDSLPADFRSQVEKDPRYYLPGDDIATVEEFRNRMQAEERGMKDNELQIALLEGSVAALKADLTAARTTADKKALQAEIDAAEAELVVRKAHRETFKVNVSTFEEAKSALLSRAEYQSVRDDFTKHSSALWLAGFAALLGAVAYVTAWSYKPSEDKDESAAPRLGILSRVENQAGAALWAAAGLERCQADPQAQVRVLVESGKGTADEPYAVRTLGVPTGCPIVGFTVIDEVATVAIPDEKVTVEYTPMKDEKEEAPR